MDHDAADAPDRRPPEAAGPGSPQSGDATAGGWAGHAEGRTPTALRLEPPFSSRGRPWCAGLWNGYVASGANREERRARLAEVPREFREAVKSHLRTIAQLSARSPSRRGADRAEGLPTGQAGGASAAGHKL